MKKRVSKKNHSGKRSVVKKKSGSSHKPRNVSKQTKKKTSSVHSKNERVPTYIPHFDGLIGGGFVKNSTNLLIGGSGTGKSVFSVQFLIGAMDRGEKCLYVTFEESKEQFFDNMLSLGWNLAEYEKKDLFTFLEYTPTKVRTMLEEGGGAIETTILEKKISRMVIDSISSFALLFQDESSQREASISLFNMIKGWNCTVLLTLEEDPLHRIGTTTRALEFEVDSTVAIYLIRGKKERQRYVEVLKMRGTTHSNKIYPLDMKKNGFVVRAKPVSNIF